MLLLICSINLFGQTRSKTDSLILIDISTIRKANEKLIELDYLKNIVSNQEDIIFNYKKLSEKQDSVIYVSKVKNINLENQLASAEFINKDLNKSINKKNTIIAILGGTTAASSIIAFLCLLMR